MISVVLCRVTHVELTGYICLQFLRYLSKNVGVCVACGCNCAICPLITERKFLQAVQLCSLAFVSCDSRFA